MRAISLSLILCLATPLLADEKEDSGYTINYSTVSIAEYLKFASKICNVNFIYNESDLPFTVTIVSEGPMTKESVMTTLIQVLRVHGLMLLEQGNSLLIHKSSDVKQLAKVVGEGETSGNVPIVTRLFRIKNAKPDSLAAVIRPMLSSEALLEISPETRQLVLTDATGNVDKVAQLIEKIDSPFSLLDIQTYTVVHNSPSFLIEVASQIMEPLAIGNQFLLVQQPLANAIYIVSTPDLTRQAIALLTSLDTPPKQEVLSASKLKTENIIIIKLMNKSGPEIMQGLQNIADSLMKKGLPDPDLLATLEGVKWLQETNSLMVVGSEESVAKTQEFISALDAIPYSEERANFFIYRPQVRTASDIEHAIEEITENLAETPTTEPALLETLRSIKVNHATNTLMFSGNPGTFPQVKEFLATADSRKGGKLNFFVYKIQSVSADRIETALNNFAKNLDKGGSEPALVETIRSMKYIPESNSLLFTGPEEAVKRIQEIIPSFDSGSIEATQFNIYKPQYASKEATENYLKQVSENLEKKGGDEDLVRTLRSAKWIEGSRSFMFIGSDLALKRTQEILKAFDTPQRKGGYFVYKLQNAPGDLVQDELDLLAKDFKASGVAESGLLSVIDKVRYIKETNSLVLTGDPQAIEEVKELIAKYDYPRDLPAKNFWMYKPQYLSADQIQKSLRETAASLKQADLADTNLLNAMASMRHVEATNSLVFTGSADALQKIENLVKEIDSADARHTPIQKVGKTTFLLYKLKNASGAQITASIKSISHDLKKTSAGDKNFLSTLGTMKYIRETNSLLFTGDEDSLQKVQQLVEKFDVSALSGKQEPAGPTEFLIYKPQSLNPKDLETVLQNFAENLKTSGLSDPSLFHTIQSMKLIEKTDSIVFTGDPASLAKLKDLLKEFDIPANAPNSTGASIQAIDNTSFLVYKLQYHKGEEIQTALKQIAKDLILTNAQVNQNLLNSINSIQWIEVTNSLLCSGDQETLTRLRELVKNLDIPLKQVYIEVLMIQTSLTNALTFGLEWGSRGQYKNQFAGNISNFIPIQGQGNNSTTPTTDFFGQQLQALSPTQGPSASNIPITPSFDLGVIGQIIRHGGQSFVNFGSLLNALANEDETTILMTPKIIGQDGKTSTVFSGFNIPFVGSFVQNVSQSTINTANIEYRDTGISLTITPVLGNSDIITLDIEIDQSDVANNQQGNVINLSGTNVNGITTSKITMSTTVHVPDKHIVVLSGIANNSLNKQKTGLPCLGGLPLLGAAFSQNNTTDQDTSLVIFLKPHIINSFDDIRAITQQEEEFFRDQAGSPYLRHNFDESMELLKSAEDD
jgi:type II secretory pathway component GspD/PulD (secretin)